MNEKKSENNEVSLLLWKLRYLSMAQHLCYDTYCFELSQVSHSNFKPVFKELVYIVTLVCSKQIIQTVHEIFRFIQIIMIMRYLDYQILKRKY